MLKSRRPQPTAPDHVERSDEGRNRSILIHSSPCSIRNTELNAAGENQMRQTHFIFVFSGLLFVVFFLAYAFVCEARCMCSPWIAPAYSERHQLKFFLYALYFINLYTARSSTTLHARVFFVLWNEGFELSQHKVHSYSRLQLLEHQLQRQRYCL